jgi:predicted ATPase
MAHLDWIRIENFRCIQRLELTLGPLQAVVGPNDVGKSSILQALLVPRAQRTRLVDLQIAPNTTGITWPLGSGKTVRLLEGRAPEPVAAWREKTLPGALFRPEPAVMRRPSGLLEGTVIRWPSSHDGAGIAGALDALLSLQLDDFHQLRARFSERFPTVKQLVLRANSPATKQVGVLLRSGKQVEADQLSDGMLYWLAFELLRYTSRPARILVEEPENGLHPARIAEIVGILREVAEKGTQVVMATHSPLVLNELSGEEILVVTRDPERGTQAVRLSDTPDYATRAKVYANGELWVAYCDGVSEKALVEGGPRP